MIDYSRISVHLSRGGTIELSKTETTVYISIREGINLTPLPGITLEDASYLADALSHMSGRGEPLKPTERK